MAPSPAGALVEMTIGIVFLGAAAAAARRHPGRPPRTAMWSIVVDVVVGLAAVADAASTMATGTARLLLWAGASLALAAAMVLLTHRFRHQRPDPRR